MILVRVGAPFWLSVIVTAWGMVAVCFAFMQNRWQFYLLRLLLGVAEAGSFPGMWYHLSLFYSSQDLGLAYSYVALGSAVSQVSLCPEKSVPRQYALHSLLFSKQQMLQLCTDASVLRRHLVPKLMDS